MKVLPIVVTAYNRPKHLKTTLDSLALCEYANDSDLYIFIDGAKERDKVLHSEVVAVAGQIKGFNSVTVTSRLVNVGLATNVISSVTHVMRQHDGAIVLEDDMQVNKHFLAYMNGAHYHYQNNPHVGCITGYRPPVLGLENTEFDVFCSSRSSTWGWSMTSSNWLSIDWDTHYFERLLENQHFLEKFDWAGNDRVGLLRAFLSKKLDIWGVRRGAWQVANEKLTLYPKYSLLRNTGLDGSGQHCGIWQEHDIGYKDDFSPLSFPEISGYVFDDNNEKLLRDFYSK